jgi:hypothetical protein
MDSYREEPAAYVLVQKPVAELEKLHTSSRLLDVDDVNWPPKAVTQSGEIKDSTLELEATLTPGDSRSLVPGLKEPSAKRRIVTLATNDAFCRAVFLHPRTHLGSVSVLHLQIQPQLDHSNHSKELKLVDHVVEQGWSA